MADTVRMIPGKGFVVLRTAAGEVLQIPGMGFLVEEAAAVVSTALRAGIIGGGIVGEDTFN